MVIAKLKRVLKGSRTPEPANDSDDSLNHVKRSDGSSNAVIELEKEGNDLPPDQLAILERQGGSSKPKKVGIFALWRYATWRERSLNMLGLGAAICAGIAQPAMTIAFGGLTTNFTTFSSSFGGSDDSNFTSSVDKNLKILVGIGAGMLWATYTYSTIFQITGEITSRRVRERYLAGCLRQNIGYIETVGAGEISTRITTDCNLYQAGISDKVPLLIQFFSMFVAGFVIAFVVNWKISIVLLSIIPAIVIAGALMGTITTRAKEKSLSHLSEAGVLAEEAISSVRIVQAFGTQERIAQLYDVPNALAEQMGRRFGLATAVGVACFFIIIYSSYALAFFWGTTVYLDGDATVGNIITTFFSLVIGAFSLSEAAPCITAILSATSAAAKLYDVIERVPPIDSQSPQGHKIPATQLQGNLELRNVVFRYPSRPAVQILRNLSLTFPANKMTALVGASGCGKTSCIALLLRFYDPLDGQVLLDGVPLTELNLQWLRSQIGLVSQEPVLFSQSVYENVAQGLVNTPLEHVEDSEKRRLVEEACVIANADIFVRALPDSYATRIGERGLLLSGGQRQRIAIARAIVSKPAILLLDEATSALDSKSERVVQDALDRAAEGRTTIAIAHRLSTIRKADQIHVIAAGEVIESGNHQELLVRNGAYARLVTAQRLKETNAESDANVSESSSPEADLEDEKTLILEEEKDLTKSPLNRQLSVASEIIASLPAQARIQRYTWVQCFRRLFAMNKSQWRLYLLGVAGAAGLGCVYPVFSIIFGNIIGVYTSPDPHVIRTEANRYSGYLFAVACVSSIFMFASITGWNLSAEALARHMRMQAMRATLKQDIAFFDDEKNSTGALTSSIPDNAEKTTAMFGSTGGVVVQSVVTLSVGLIVGLVYSWRIALVGFACTPLTVTTGLIRLYVVILRDTRNDASHNKSAQLACESANAVRTVASLTRENDVVRLYSHELEEPQQRTIRFALAGNLLYSFSQASTMWIIALTFWYGSRLLVEGKTGVVDFYIALESVVFGAIEVGNIFMYVPDASKCIVAANAFLKLYDAKPEIDAESTAGKTLQITQGSVTVDNVHFRYKTRPHVPVLRGLSLEIRPGQTIALVGPSGCGKSTVISLLERYYDPLTGVIRLDGHALPELNVANYRSYISLVAQESALYAGSIKTNVLLGTAKSADQVTQAELEEACKAANIYDFIASLPDGFETQLGGKGAQLSGGQRQRVSLARALIRNPAILLLDEATSALDSESEKVVQVALDNAAKGRSTIAVAHRLSTIRDADQIFVVEGGRIAEAGTYDQLLAKKAIFYDLVVQQSLEN